MADATVTITLEGVEYKLRFKGLALDRFTSEFGETFEDAMRKLYGRPINADTTKEEIKAGVEEQVKTGEIGMTKSVTAAAKILWAAMLRYQPDMKYADVLDMVGPDNLHYVMTIINGLLNPLDNSQKAG